MKLKILITAYWAKVVDGISVAWRFTVRKLKKLFLPIQVLLGLKVIKDDTKSRSVDISAYLTETDEQIRSLPDEISDQFRPEKKIERERYISPANNLMQFESACKQWKNGFSSCIVVTGEKGSGKSVFIRMALEHTETKEPTHISVNETSWKKDQVLKKLGESLKVEDYSKPEAIIREIRNRDQRQVVVLEDIQNLYLRSINGFDGMEALWLILSETREHILWICTCSRYAWQYLVKARGVDTHFTHILSTDVLDQAQVEEMISKRVEDSGFEIFFEADEQQRRSRSYRKRMDKEEDLQDHLKEHYFEKLNQIAEGNASVALLYWLRSLRTTDDTKVVKVLPIQSVGIESLDILDSEALFVMSVIVFHDTLRITEVSRILNMNVLNSRVILTKLRSRGILVEKEGWYSLNHLVYRQTVRLLKSRNIIH